MRASRARAASSPTFRTAACCTRTSAAAPSCSAAMARPRRAGALPCGTQCACPSSLPCSSSSLADHPGPNLSPHAALVSCCLMVRSHLTAVKFSKHMMIVLGVHEPIATLNAAGAFTGCAARQCRHGSQCCAGSLRRQPGPWGAPCPGPQVFGAILKRYPLGNMPPNGA
jgi:hypothetical protein